MPHAISKVILASVLAVTLSLFANHQEDNQVQAASEGDVISSYTLSSNQVDEVVNNMEVLDGEVRNYGTIMSGIFGKAGIPVALAYNVGIGSQLDNYQVFETAQAMNRPVVVQVIAGATPNLNTTNFMLGLPGAG